MDRPLSINYAQSRNVKENTEIIYSGKYFSKSYLTILPKYIYELACSQIKHYFNSIKKHIQDFEKRKDYTTKLVKRLCQKVGSILASKVKRPRDGAKKR